KTFKLGKTESIDQECQSCTINKTININVKKQFVFLDRVEEKLGLRPDGYQFHVNPQLQGTITYQGYSYRLQDGNGITFDRSKTKLILQKDEQSTITKE